MANDENVLTDRQIQRAVSNIKPRAEREPELGVLQRTFVDTGILPQLLNGNNQILYGRRGTGKSHVLRVLGAEFDHESGSASHLYLDLRYLGSAHLMTDESQPVATRCVAIFRDLISAIQDTLLDIATDPEREPPGNALEAVSSFTDAITHVTRAVTGRDISVTHATSDSSGSHIGINVGTAGFGIDAGLNDESDDLQKVRETFHEVLRETIVFSEVSRRLDEALVALGIDRFLLLLDEWTAIPPDLQPYISEFLKRTLFGNPRVTIKIASLEYRSHFNIQGDEEHGLIGFELGPDIVANLDLDDYYVYARNPDSVVASFLELLYQHLGAELPNDYLRQQFAIRNGAQLRAFLFTEPNTFAELVRAGEGVVRDFLGIFSEAYYRAIRKSANKIDMRSIEEAARDWFETDKATNLSKRHEVVLNRITSEVIGSRAARSFLLERSHASNPMIQSLFDLRILHLIARGYSDKENPGLRYNIYSLDYGTYVDLKRTHSQPDLDYLEVEGPSFERVVPFDDKRSIRRIILDPAILES